MRSPAFAKLIVIAVMLPALAWLGSAQNKESQPTELWRALNQDDIFEAVFRHQFERNASASQGGAAAYCLQLGKQTDPTDAFIKRFRGNRPPVREGSECEFSRSRGVVIDKATKKEALIFRVTGIRWVSGEEVEVSGGYSEGNMSASGNTYTVKKEGGRWRVTSDVMNWIS